MATDRYKVLVVEKNGTDLDSQTELDLKAANSYFDNVASPAFVADNVQDAIVEARGQSGQILPGLFSGTPKKYTVTLPLVFPTNNYTVGIEGADGRVWIAENLTTTTFDINSQANATLFNIVYWTAKLNP